LVAPYDQHDERVRDKAPQPIQYTSYMPEVQRVAPPRVQRRRKRRRLLIKIPWIPISVVVLLVFVVVGGYLVFGSMRQERVAESPLDTEAGIIYITATPDISIAQTATSVLPAEYMQALSLTPGPIPTQGGDIDALRPTPTSAFESVGPVPEVFDLWSSLIVYACFVDGSDEICAIKANGTEQRQLTSLKGTDYYPSLSPDGQTIYWSSQRGKFNFDIYSMDTAGGNIQRLTNGEGDNYAPELSPDGTRIVYTHYAKIGEKDDQDIWVMNADGSNPHPVTFDTTNEIDPSWSPDGTMISFTSNRSISNELFIMNADGSNVRQLTRGMSIGGRNDWSPDGTLLTFYAGPGSEKEVFVVSIECIYIGGCDRTLIRQLTTGGQNKGPAFSPDGQWIVFTTKRDGDNEIMMMRVDGTDMRTLTTNYIPDWMPRWGP
jgi:Tol biopolymer transport system component